MYVQPGMENSCKCPDPMVGLAREGRRHWMKTAHENKDKVLDIREDLDVVFYGDSITEGWMGTSFGFPNGRKDKNEQVFNSLFSLDHGGKYKGLALGISGDLVSKQYSYNNLQLVSFIGQRAIFDSHLLYVYCIVLFIDFIIALEN